MNRYVVSLDFAVGARMERTVKSATQAQRVVPSLHGN